MPLETPRDRNGSYEPKIIGKSQTRFTGFDDKIISMYARGMSTREIQGHLEEIYKVEVSPTLISNVTEAVMEEVKSLAEPAAGCGVSDRLPGRAGGEDSRDRARAQPGGVRGDWREHGGQQRSAGAVGGPGRGGEFWLQVLTELKNRGVDDIFIACVDGLKGFPEAIETVFPEAQVQLCIVHQVRASLNYVSWKQRRRWRRICSRSTVPARWKRPNSGSDEFGAKWDGTYPTISQMWRRNWEHLTPFFAYPADIRKVIYTTNAVESLNMSLRKVIKTRGSFPTQEAAMKLLYLALEHIAKKWTKPVKDWKAALQRFAILLGDRVPKADWPKSRQSSDRRKTTPAQSEPGAQCASSESKKALL